MFDFDFSIPVTREGVGDGVVVCWRVSVRYSTFCGLDGTAFWLK